MKPRLLDLFCGAGGAAMGADAQITLNGSIFQVRKLMDEHSWRVSRRALVARVR